MNSGPSCTLAIDGITPQIDADAFVAPGAALIGRVRLAARASVWYKAQDSRSYGQVQSRSL
ncbi:hypothetical protein [Saccharopolyspora phatthalungensis]|uniref:Carbonic anhydrase/acetyltransferase-like protein (Isoleucine patch superfamily) n=1 Tax=Saccharopolyspora phatthalungensis TaxID=664693 RepID=A0A840QBS0_9PSEU|nr:hypothetical protein [Saccharopolyspora phatthalungensis]MBB5158194.1 carbonic anhydrase/acetyltransferase-like protein (isoleucine patch superfamily) [Saccharopolyspora phatthalungensis]